MKILSLTLFEVALFGRAKPDLLAQVLFSHMIAAAFVTFGNWDCRLQLGGISGTSRPQDVECHTGMSSGV